MPAYISELAYAGSIVSDFVEVAVPTGTDVSSWSLAYYNNFGDYQISMADHPSHDDQRL